MKRGLWIAAGLAVAVIALILYRLQGFDWSKFWSDFFATFKKVDWRWLSVSAALLLLTYFIRALRWTVMLRPIREKPGLWNITSATVIGFTSLVLLGRPGEVVRPYLISVKEHVPFASQMAAWALERILDLLSVLLIFGIGLVSGREMMDPSFRWIGFVVAFLGVLCIVLLVAFRSFAAPAQRRIMSAVTFLPEKVRSRIEKTMAAFVEGMKCTQNQTHLTLIVAYTAAQWVIIVVGNYCLVRSVPGTAPFGLVKVMIFLGFTAFGSTLQIPGIGGGVQLAALGALKLLKVAGASATVAATLVWLMGFVAIVPFGLALAFHEGINWKKIRHIQEEAEPVPAQPPTTQPPPPL